MDTANIRRAAHLLAEARRTRELIEALPPACQPATIDEAHAIQDELTAQLGETVAGWKVGSKIDGTVMQGAIHASRTFESPARIEAASMPLRGVEAEIAFVFDEALPPRAEAYAADEVAAAVTAFPAIEIVDSRFLSYAETPLLHRAADCVSNGGFVRGPRRENWRDVDLAKLAVTLTVDGEPIVQRIGGHAAGDPILPAVDLVNQLRLGRGVAAGQFMTTGTYTGLNFVGPDSAVVAAFSGFGAVSLRFVP